MADITQNQLVTDVAHDVVAQMAPQELPFFSVTTEAYFKNPKKMRQEQVGKDETLGFGVGEIAAFSPIIIAIADDTLKYILGELIPQEIKASGIMSRIFKNKRSAHTKDKQVTLPLSLTPEQLRLVQEEALRSAMPFKQLSHAQANQLATSLVGRLALANK
jgi:hypothetical protein